MCPKRPIPQQLSKALRPVWVNKIWMEVTCVQKPVRDFLALFSDPVTLEATYWDDRWRTPASQSHQMEKCPDDAQILQEGRRKSTFASLSRGDFQISLLLPQSIAPPDSRSYCCSHYLLFVLRRNSESAGRTSIQNQVFTELPQQHECTNVCPLWSPKLVNAMGESPSSGKHGSKCQRW